MHSSAAARRGSAAEQIADTTAIPSAPAVITSAALPASIPPMPASGRPDGNRSRSARTPAGPSGAVVSVFVAVGQTGLAAT